MREFLGILAGIVAGLAALIVIAMIGGLIIPAPTQFEASNPQQLIDIFTTMPMAAKIAIILSWFGGALAGAAVAKLIIRRGWAAWSMAGIFAVYVLINTFVLPMPSWMQVLAVALPLVGGLIANHLVAERAPIEEAATAGPADAPAAREPDDAGL